MSDAEDHAAAHLLCRYAVTMNGKRYRYDHVAGQEDGFGSDLRDAQCHEPAEREKVQRRLVETTARCVDAHAGAYWGFDLVELP